LLAGDIRAVRLSGAAGQLGHPQAHLFEEALHCLGFTPDHGAPFYHFSVPAPRPVCLTPIPLSYMMMAQRGVFPQGVYETTVVTRR
jgi:hypothetical protein